MCMCVGAYGRALNSKKSTAAVFLAQFSASLGFASLYRLVERGCYRVIALFYKEGIECSLVFQNNVIRITNVTIAKLLGRHPC